MVKPWLSVLLVPVVSGPGAACASDAFSLSTPAFVDGGTLPKAQVYGKASCGSGGDRSPPLSWTAPPPGTRSLAVTSFDPDAGHGQGWWHWAAFNLPPATRGLAEGAGAKSSTPGSSLQGANSFGVAGYGGACPPAGEPPHRYVFTIWAVGDDKLPFDSGSRDEEVGAWLAAHALGKASVTARYGR